MNKNAKNAASGSNTLINVIIGVIIAAFLAVGVYATYGKIADSIEENAVTSGEKEATVSYLAKQAGMSVEDYLAQYGLALGDTITKDTTESEMMDNMTIENYLLYNGGTETADEVIEGTGLTDQVTKDTLWKDFLPLVPVVSVIGEDSFNSLKEQLGLGDEVTEDMPYGEFEQLLQDLSEETSYESTEEAPAEENTSEETSEESTDNSASAE